MRKSSSNSRKRTATNYSPVSEMSRSKFDKDFPPIELKTNVKRGRQFHHPEHDEPRLEPSDSISVGNQSIPEEVYLCDCCGITKELSPSIKFMPTFKRLFFLFNYLVFIFGFANFAMGLWFRIDPKVYEIHHYIETQNFTIAGWIMLFSGFTTCIISLIGCIASAKEVNGLLGFYFIIMIILTLSFVGTLVLLSVYGFGMSLEHFLIKEIYEQIRRRAVNVEMDTFVTSDAAQFLDFIQVKMRCCGAADFRDYSKLGMVVPTTCYSIEKNYIISPGCGRAIRELFDLRGGLAVGFTCGSIVSQIFTIILSALIFCSIYHWRAQPRPVTPVHQEPIRTRESPAHLYQQRPRSRTPIII